MLSISQAILAIVVAAAVTFFTRAVPFIFFAKKKPSPLMAYLQRYLPPMTMVILVIYCIRDIQWAEAPHGLPALIGIALTTVLHLWRGNALLSIFGATAVYMFLIRTM
jgi:branched-subunit amino acid transport protein AzlD